ncbi:hypothetical protein E2562_023842 [Oryza meyeriana var. granulata]|uniref:Uncharacterized protein n=1 Tax=Oryza meyeriana var. granulata TaxID=110450 RepID=A0A6G1D751_9ORYZ|nr:hypothetical protein E2562_023842 [Oryza meyeriana var. granulata]
MSASGGSGGCGKRTMADVLMGNARDAVRKATTALSPKRLKTQPGAQVDGAVAKPEVEGKPPLPVKSKRAPSLKKLKT